MVGHLLTLQSVWSMNDVLVIILTESVRVRCYAISFIRGKEQKAKGNPPEDCPLPFAFLRKQKNLPLIKGCRFTPGRNLGIEVTL